VYRNEESHPYSSVSNASIFTFRSFLKQRRKVFLLGIIIVALLEFFVFNLPMWETLHSSPQTITNTEMTLQDMKSVPDGLMITGDNGGSVIIDNQSSDDVDYVHFNNAASVSSQQNGSLVWYRIAIYYPNDTTLHSMGNYEPMSTESYQSRYINLGSYDSHVAIQFSGSKGTIIPFSSLTVNPHIGLNVNPVCIAVMVFVLLLILTFGSGSSLWGIALNTKSKSQVMMLILTTIGVMITYLGIWLFASGWSVWVGMHPSSSIWYSYNQYANLANSLLHGHTWLDLPVSEGLKHLTDPYNYNARIGLSASGSFSFWDHAYYNGHYYCYFGVIPAIIFFMPYEILSGGQWLPSAYAILISVLLGAIFATLFVTRLAKTYFKDPSLGAVMFGIWMMGIGSGILYHVFTCSFYSVPEAASYMFTLAALWCWLSSIKHPNKVSIPWVFFGSLFMACNLGCRPQFMFAALLAIPIYWNAVFKDRSLFSRRGFWPTVMAILPFVLVFVPLMMYNVARFGSPLNFGNKYQLTVFDANTAQFPHSSVFSIAFYYLFQPMSLIGIFPFVSSTQMPGLLYFPLEPSEGGFFTFVAPFAIILFLAPWVYSKKRHFIIKNNF